MSKFDLYFKPECPYCLKVLNFMKENKIVNFTSYNIKDGRSGEENTKELIELGGKDQVPFMVFGDEKMYESDDIIEYLKENY